MVNLTPVLLSPSFEHCSVIRHQILHTRHHCAMNTKKKHVCSNITYTAWQNWMDCCFFHQTFIEPAVIEDFNVYIFLSECRGWVAHSCLVSHVTVSRDRHHHSNMSVHLLLHTSCQEQDLLNPHKQADAHLSSAQPPPPPHTVCWKYYIELFYHNWLIYTAV